jgi:glucosamine--fructose-6-phosphate aminotransferase (isomerizing)
MHMSWLEAELREQPDALARFLDAEARAVQALAGELAASGVRYVTIAARGSSDNAARYAQYVFGIVNRLPVALATPSLYTLYEAPPRLEAALVVGISQSGASPDVAAVVADARAQGCPTLAITNDPSSRLATAAEHVVALHAGEERSVAATKTYLNSIAAVALLSAALAQDEARLGELLAIPGRVREQIELSAAGVGVLDRYAEVEAGTVVGRGIAYGTAFEIALKIRELSGLPVEAFSGADLLHGPIAAVGASTLALLVAPSGPALDGTAELVDQLRARGVPVAGISDDPALLGRLDSALPLVAGVPEWLSPFVAVIPGQYAGLRLATLRGGDVDRPHGLQKVTLTR